LTFTERTPTVFVATAATTAAIEEVVALIVVLLNPDWYAVGTVCGKPAIAHSRSDAGYKSRIFSGVG
jgi:hypothetical protein